MTRAEALRRLQAARRMTKRTERDMLVILDDPSVTREQRAKATEIIRLRFERVYQELDRRELELGVRPNLRRVK